MLTLNYEDKITPGSGAYPIQGIDHVSNPLLANLAKWSQVLPFGSTVPKGGHKKINEAETFIGPGYYDH